MPYFDPSVSDPTFAQVAARLRSDLDAAEPRLRALTEAAASERRAAGKNRHLAHVMAAIPESHRGVPVEIGGRPPVTLGWIARDYVGHIQHHLAQILDGDGT